MKILVANLGSTSFKYRLFDMSDERQLARGGVERIGDPESRVYAQIGESQVETTQPVLDHAVAVQQCLAQLTDPRSGCLTTPQEVAAIGFKAVHGGRVSGAQIVDEDVLAAMEEMSPIAPAHNPPYIRAMRLLGEKLPEIPLVAAFETGFHASIKDAARDYAIPRDWAERLQVRKWGFHGASHRYIATRTAQLLGRDDLKIVSLHLGGSSSLCGIRGGQSVGTTMGMSPQTGLPQNNRVGDFDPFALPYLMQKTGLSLEGVLETLASQGGLLGVSGLSGDIRDLRQAAREGHAGAQAAIELYVAEIRRHLGGLLVELGGADALVFTAGIGENGPDVRAAVCRDLDFVGVHIDEEKNQNAQGEAAIHADSGSPNSATCQVWVIPTNEELVVARQTVEVATKSKPAV